jgi:hypothetical protein
MSVVVDFEEYRRKRERARVADTQPQQVYCWYPIYWTVMIWPAAPYAGTYVIASGTR